MIKKKTYPLKYFCRGSGGTREKSDRERIMHLMGKVPDHLKDEVSNKYEKLFGDGMNGGRGRANTYLENVSSEFSKEEPNQNYVVNGIYDQLIEMPKEEIKKNFTKAGNPNKKRWTGKKILEM